MLRGRLARIVVIQILFLVGSHQALWAAAGDLVFEYTTASGGWINDGIDSTPAVGADGTIYFGDSGNVFYALRPDGALKWKYQTTGDNDSSPTIASDGTIYFGSSDGHLYALDAEGTLKWKYETTGEIVSSPAIGNDGTIHFGCRNCYFYALYPDGTLKWKYQTAGWIDSSPGIDKNGTVYFGSRDRGFYALNPDGTFKWRFQTGDEIASSPAIDQDGTVYFGSADGSVYALKPDGTLKWRYEPQFDQWRQIYASPVIGADGSVYIGSWDNKLYALDSDGALKWLYEATIGGGAPIIGYDSTIYFGAWDHHLHAITPDGVLKWKFNANSGIWSPSPALSDDGIIYIGTTGGSLYAVDTGTATGIAQTAWPKFQRNQKNSGRSPNIRVTPLELEIANVAVNSSGTGTFTVENVGIGDLSIHIASSDTQLFTLSHESTTLAPSAILEVTVIFSPTAPNDASARITVATDKEDVFQVTVQGKVVIPRIAVSPQVVRIGYVSLHQQNSASFSVANEELIELIVNRISSDNSAFTVLPTSLRILPGENKAAEIVFAPREEGSASANVTVESNDPNNSEVTILTEGYGFNQVLSGTQLSCVCFIDDPSSGMMHIDAAFAADDLSQRQTTDFKIKNFNIRNIEFDCVGGNSLTHENWQSDFDNIFRVHHDGSGQIGIKLDLKMEYVVPFEEYPVHAGGKSCFLNESFGLTEGWHYFLPLPVGYGVTPEVIFRLPDRWAVLRGDVDRGGGPSYSVYSPYESLAFGEFALFERDIQGTTYILAFHSPGGCVPNVDTDFGFSIVEYFVNILGPYPTWAKLLAGGSMFFKSPLVWNYSGTLAFPYNLSMILLYPHFLAIDFLPYIIGGESWFGEGYTGYYQIAALYESANGTLRLFNQSLSTSQWNYENIIRGHTDEVSLHDANTIMASNTSLCFQIKEDKGTLVTFLIDRAIREATSNTKNVNDFSRHLYESYKTRLFNDEEMLNALNTFTGHNFTDFFNRYVFGLDPLPLDGYLNDNDDDGLLNFTEDDLGTDKNSSDSDEDGVSDALESYYYFTDPLDYYSCPDTSEENYSDASEAALLLADGPDGSHCTPITVDGYGGDWEDVPFATVDPKLDFGGFEYDDADIRYVKAIVQNGALYLHVGFHAGHSRTIAYDVFLNTTGVFDSSEFNYLLRYDTLGNAFLYRYFGGVMDLIAPGATGPIDLSLRPMGIGRVFGACKETLEISLPLDLIGSPTGSIAAELLTVDCVHVSTVNCPSMVEARWLPYLVGDTARFTIPIEIEPPVVTSAASDTAICGVPYRYTATATHSEQTPSIHFEQVPSWLTVSGDMLTGTPQEGDPDTSFTVIAAVASLSDTLIVHLTVLHATNVITDHESKGYPTTYRLYRNVPNPFNASTVIAYDIPVEAGKVEVILNVYNLLGQQVCSLVSGKVTGGHHQLVWDGRDDQGLQMASGVYICRLRSKEFVSSKRMALIK